jgi:hypothetical protein
LIPNYLSTNEICPFAIKQQRVYYQGSLCYLITSLLYNDAIINQTLPIFTLLRATLHATNTHNRGPPVITRALITPFTDKDLAT